jgi:hemerythrin-like domain-containing protein
MPNSSDRHRTDDAKGRSHDANPALARLFLTHLKSLDDLCRDLEAIADELPSSINVQTSLVIAANIVPIVKSAHKFEEDHVYPVLLDAVRHGTTMKEEIYRLKSEHLADEDLGEEVCLALREFVADQNPAKAETLSWMLRGFFESMRRHLAYEHAVILPVILKKLGTKNARS